MSARKVMNASTPYYVFSTNPDDLNKVSTTQRP
jgi:hypothetical protein